MMRHITCILLLLYCKFLIVTASASRCKVFVPTGQCIHGSRINHSTPHLHCAPVACDFNSAIGCVVPSSGYFESHDVCDPYEQVLDGPSPTTSPDECGPGGCCTSSLPGEFVADGQGGYTYQPVRQQRQQQQQQQQQEQHSGGGSSAQSTCKYAEYGFSAILECMARRRIEHVVVIGDSMMRQMHNSLVNLFRGTKRVVDYTTHANAYYRVCPEADHFSLGPLAGKCWGEQCMNDEHYAAIQADLHAMHDANRPGRAEALAACSSRPLSIDYIFSPQFWTQVIALETHVAAHRDTLARTLFVVAIDFWHYDAQVPQDWVDLVEGLIEGGSTVAVATAPIANVKKQVYRDEIALRNERMRTWVRVRHEENPHGRFLLLDTEAIAAVPFMPSQLPENWHYQCFLQKERPQDGLVATHGSTHFFVRHGGGSESDEDGGDGEHRYVSIYTSVDGRCHDDFNRAAWRVLLNMLCSPPGGRSSRGGAAGGGAG